VVRGNVTVRVFPLITMLEAFNGAGVVLWLLPVPVTELMY
jgi:hypothetical protein